MILLLFSLMFNVIHGMCERMTRVRIALHFALFTAHT